MREIAILLLLAGVSGCNRNGGERDSPPATPAKAELTFDGATAPARDAMLAHGERLSHVLGCRGCHTPTLEGQWFNDDQPQLGKIYATNLTRALPQYTDAQLESVLREGIHPTRRDLWMMPSKAFQRLSKADMTALIAHLRTIKPSGKPTPPPMFSGIAKAAIASGKLKPSAAQIAEFRRKLPVDLGGEYAFGRYLAGATCAECHGPDLTGVPDFGPGLSTPNLDIAGAYSEAELAKLLTTGEGKVRRDLGLMSEVGKSHFSYLTPRERDAVVRYVLARARRKP